MRDQEVIDFGWEDYINEAEEMFVDVGILPEDGAQKRPPTAEGKQTDITLAQLAAIQEYGVEIAVTPKMRGYLGANGFHISKSKTHISIPSRPFMRQTFDEEMTTLSKLSEQLEDDIRAGRKTRKQALEALGQAHRNQIQKAMATPGKFEENHPFTVKQKGSSQPLIDTGGLRQAIDYEVQ